MSWDRNSNWDVKLLQKMWSKYNGAIDETTILSFMTPTIREHELDNKLRKYLESQKAAAKYNIFKEEKEKEEITQFKLPKENLRYAEAEGILWTWGSNSYGQTGHFDNMPAPVPALKKIKIRQVSCGLYHTACLSEEGTMYTWGRHLEGQLGRRIKDNNAGEPQIVERFGKAVINQISCGRYHTACLTGNPEFYELT